MVWSYYNAKVGHCCTRAAQKMQQFKIMLVYLLSFFSIIQPVGTVNIILV